MDKEKTTYLMIIEFLQVPEAETIEASHSAASDVVLYIYACNDP